MLSRRLINRIRRTVNKSFTVFLVVIMVLTNIPSTVRASDGTVAIFNDSSVSEIQSLIEIEIENVKDSEEKTVRVIGHKSGVKESLTMEIPKDITVVWEADYKADSWDGDMIYVSGKDNNAGTFEITEGNISSSKGCAVYVTESFTGTVNITGGRISSFYSPLFLGSSADVNISGGVIEGIYDPAVKGLSEEYGTITISDEAVISTLRGYIGAIDLASSNLIIKGGEIKGENYGIVLRDDINCVISEGEITGKTDAIVCIDETNVVITGGSVVAEEGNAIYIGSGTAIFLPGTCVGMFAGDEAGMIVEADTLAVPEPRHGTDDGLTIKHGENNGTVKWDTSGSIPIIKFIKEKETTPLPWGAVICSLTVLKGTGSGKYFAGTKVKITANPAKEGTVFNKWTSNSEIEFLDSYSEESSFTMPAHEVVVTATYLDLIQEISTQSVVYIVKWKTVILPVAIRPNTVINKNVRWSSADSKIATVDVNTGKVKGLKKGSTTITVTAEDGNKTAVCQVYVVKKAKKLKKLTIAPTEPVGLIAGQVLQITTKISPIKATGVVVKYSSSNTAVATVDSMGQIKAVSPGNVTITVKAGSKSKKLKLTVGTVLPSEIVLSESDITIKIKEKFSLSVDSWNPIDSNPLTVYWSTSNKKIATVNSLGVVKGIKKGKVTIYATTWNGIKVACRVTVK